MKHHQYKTELIWTGNQGSGTNNYKTYERSYTIGAAGKPGILGSSDPSFRGDKSKYNPEELFLASISSCHMLWYLHLCSVAGVIVLEYTDNAIATMLETDDGGGRFTEVTLYPTVIVSDVNMIDKANQIHHEANKMCFIANSCNFPIKHEPVSRKL
ncbi:OsmC family protein [Chitinophagaceae bacterium LWZ2-11]